MLREFMGVMPILRHFTSLMSTWGLWPSGSEAVGEPIESCAVSVHAF
jgi:hypothetical protein